jgi:GNAT superfamily N-acetyltransferase
MPTIAVERTFLELTDPAQLVPFRIEDPLLRLARVPVPSVQLVQRLYREVGEQYHWVDRWTWSDAEWRAWVSRVGYGVWLLSWDGELAGFFELKSDEAGSAEIELIGLVAAFQGRGLGKHLLTAATEIAFAVGNTRVWLHTCTLDDPKALPNYQKRGYREFKKESYQTSVPTPRSP